MPTFPVTIQHLEVGIRKTFNTSQELIDFLLSQNASLWSDWRAWPDIVAAMQAAGAPVV